MLKLFKKISLATSLVLTLSATAIAAQTCIEYTTDGGPFVTLHSGKSVSQVPTLVEYGTVVGYQDLFNSRGTSLTGFMAVLQQDRANVNRFNKPDRTNFDTYDGSPDFVDDKDDFFTTADRRALFQDMVYVGHCFQDAADIRSFKNRVVTANALYLYVSIFKLPSGGLAVHISEAG